MIGNQRLLEVVRFIFEQILVGSEREELNSCVLDYMPRPKVTLADEGFKVEPEFNYDRCSVEMYMLNGTVLVSAHYGHRQNKLDVSLCDQEKARAILDEVVDALLAA